MAKSNKLVAGVGINDADYAVTKWEGSGKGSLVWKCPFYDTWANMLSRAYGTKRRHDAPTYEDVTVAEEWHTFSTFKSWMEQQRWEGKALDKDILYRGNRVYGPDTCCFVSAKINSFVIDSRARRSEINVNAPPGIYFSVHGTYLANLWQDKVPIRRIKTFSTLEAARLAWAEAKLAYVPVIAEAEGVEEQVRDALISRYSALADEARSTMH